jgi:hypothetical protein
MVNYTLFQSQRLPADGSQTPLYFEKLVFLLRGQLRWAGVLPVVLSLPRLLRGLRDRLVEKLFVRQADLQGGWDVTLKRSPYLPYPDTPKCDIHPSVYAGTVDEILGV